MGRQAEQLHFPKRFTKVLFLDEFFSDLQKDYHGSFISENSPIFKICFYSIVLILTAIMWVSKINKKSHRQKCDPKDSFLSQLSPKFLADYAI